MKKNWRNRIEYFDHLTYYTASIVTEAISIRSSHPEVFCESCRPPASSFIKKETLAQALSCEFCKISNNTFSYRTFPVAVSEGY